eukprot:scaffold94_cov15-Tisochrysis_lutea.AAC.1
MLGAEIKKCVMLVACMPGIDVWRFEVRGVWCLLPGLGSPVYERSSDGYKCFLQRVDYLVWAACMSIGDIVFPGHPLNWGTC